MATESPFADSKRSRPRWRQRAFLVAAGLAVAVVAAFLAWHSIKAARIRAELNQFIANLDRDEPGWRIDALEAARARVPGAENNVPVILRARRALPRAGRWGDYDRRKALLAELSPHVRLTADQYGYCI